jgi:hypothetical protein
VFHPETKGARGAALDYQKALLTQRTPKDAARQKKSCGFQPPDL